MNAPPPLGPLPSPPSTPRQDSRPSGRPSLGQWVEQTPRSVHVLIAFGVAVVSGAVALVTASASGAIQLDSMLTEAEGVALIKAHNEQVIAADPRESPHPGLAAATQANAQAIKELTALVTQSIEEQREATDIVLSTQVSVLAADLERDSARKAETANRARTTYLDERLKGRSPKQAYELARPTARPPYGR